MAFALKKFTEALEGAYQRLPWAVRAILSVSRWYRGIAGIPAIYAGITSIAWIGAVIALFGSVPIATQVLWSCAGVAGVVVAAGQFGAALRARSGRVTLMSDIHFLRHARALSKEASSYIIRRDEPPDGWSNIPAIQNQFDRQHGVDKREEMSEYFNDCHPRVMVMLQEAVRRGVITEDEIEAILGSNDVLEEVRRFLAKLVMKLQLRSGHGGL